MGRKEDLPVEGGSPEAVRGHCKNSLSRRRRCVAETVPDILPGLKGGDLRRGWIGDCGWDGVSGQRPAVARFISGLQDCRRLAAAAWAAPAISSSAGASACGRKGIRCAPGITAGAERKRAPLEAPCPVSL